VASGHTVSNQACVESVAGHLAVGGVQISIGSKNEPAVPLSLASLGNFEEWKPEDTVNAPVGNHTFIDGAALLGEANDSVIAQRVDAWELLLFDGGSGSATTITATAYAARSSKKSGTLNPRPH
jgi:hypothetical protein